ncbi:MBL fold metallo-hydrolase [Caulobacter sp. S45]|uniref:MBL fold metallo-hydrolase n=1 Tax=Caulobacter sp. S45 TaxID=1641861 RepID=UPI001C2DA15D|nr:MBL fold metallo-hydrolase [Caulobacter sp. S45]
MIPRITVAFASSLMLFVAAPALAGPQPVAPAAQSFQLGRLKLIALRDALNVTPNDGKVIGLGQNPSAIGAVLQAAGAPTDKITLGVDALLVEGGGRVMLFDTGLGPKVQGVLSQSLALAGVSPDAVTDVFITHTHGDHVGGLVTADGRLAFPRAVVRMSATEWAWMEAQSKNPALVAAITPQVRTFEPGTEVVQGVSAVAAPGHTPGHVGYEIASGPQHLFDMGDVAHSSIVSLAKPDWAIAYDTDKTEGEATRRALLTRLAASHEPVFAPHFPFPGVGRIVAAGGGFAWSPGQP